MNLNAAVSITSVCFIYITPKGWNETLTFYFSYILYLPWVINIIYSGVTMVQGTKRTSFMNIAIFWFFWFMLWRVAVSIEWERPVSRLSFDNCQGSIFTDTINIYSFPDPNFISVTSFALSFIIVEKDITHKRPSPSQYLLFSTVVGAYSFAEWVLYRMFFYQILLNLAVAMMITLLILHVLTDIMPFFKECRSGMEEEELDDTPRLSEI